jgi:hypothetical protein
MSSLRFPEIVSSTAFCSPSAIFSDIQRYSAIFSDIQRYSAIFSDIVKALNYNTQAFISTETQPDD